MLGPTYSYADELATPSELGIGRDGSFDGILRAVAGVNYYTDAIGFGESTMLAKDRGLVNRPLGIKYFINTGATCSNGADMYEYINTVPNGLKGRVGDEVKRALGVDMRGLAPGIMEDAASALNPVPYFQAAMGSGYGRCKKVTMPVGDTAGAVQSRYTKGSDGQLAKWVEGPYKLIGGKPNQTRWVFDSYISQEEYDAAPKTEKAGVVPETEGFSNSNSNSNSNLSAGLLFAALFMGIIAYVKTK